jgi:uncharacterized protein
VSSAVVHLELHTPDRRGAREFYSSLLGWQPQEVEAQGRSYLALEFGNGLGGGIVECGAPRPVWVPYVEVREIGSATAKARELGARVLLEPREGPAGWRSVIAVPAGGEVALWEQKTR